MDKWQEAQRRHRHRKRHARNEGSRRFSLEIQAHDKESERRNENYRSGRFGDRDRFERRWYDEEPRSSNLDDWWPVGFKDEYQDDASNERYEAIHRQYVQAERRFKRPANDAPWVDYEGEVENAYRELREATDADDGGLEKKLQELPPSFWKRVATKIRVKSPLICTAFRTHELAVERILMTYLNMVGVAAHKGMRKYCKIIEAAEKAGRVSHNENGALDGNAPKPTLLVRFFNFVNARLETLFGRSNQEETVDSGDEESVEKNLVFHTNKLNLILFPPSMDNVQKIIESDQGEKSENLSTNELRGELWKGAQAKKGEASTVAPAPDSFKSPTPVKNTNHKRGCLGVNCRYRTVRYAHPRDWTDDEYLDDYYEQRRRHAALKAKARARARARANKRKLQYQESLDFGIPYDVNLLNPKISPDFADGPDEPTHTPPEDPDDRPGSEDIIVEMPKPSTTESINFQEYEKKYSVAPQLVIPEKTEVVPESVLGAVPHQPTTTAEPAMLDVPVNFLLFIPLGLLFFILFGIILYLCMRKKGDDDDAAGRDNDFDRYSRGRKNRWVASINAEDSTDDDLDDQQSRRGHSARPPTLQEKGDKKTRAQAYKDDFVPIEPKKKKKNLAGRFK